MPVSDPAHDPIALLLAGQYRDPEGGKLLGCEARSVVIEDSLEGREAELVEALGLGKKLALLADVDTYGVMGERVEKALESRFEVQRLVLPRRPYPDRKTINLISAELAPGTDAVVAVGSGTINDLAKVVALHANIPQVVFGTAPSMNGYTSVSASVSEEGVKRSMRARTPVGVFLDLGVLAEAPLEMIRAGLGDSVARSTAQADWLLAHLLLDQPYREAPFALLAEDEKVLFASGAALVNGDRTAMRALARTLVLSGFGMTLCGGSFPASQGEHLISHYLEMMRPAGVIEALHGAQVGVASVFSAWVQQAMLAKESIVVRRTSVTREEVLKRFGEERGAVCWREFAAKQVHPDTINARLAAKWPEIRARIQAIASTPDAIASILDAAGAPSTPAALGYPDDFFESALFHARELRDRYTFLDLASDGSAFGQA